MVGIFSSKNSQSGNVFFALFGAVGLVGVLGAATTTIIKGPVRSMQTVTKSTVAENQMIAAGRLSLISNLNTDCDGDGFVEPMQWSTSGTGTAPTGGGFLPSTVGAAQQDPWGTTFGFCVWDHGAQINAAGCGGASQLRRRGTTTEDQIAIAVLSAGPDRVFQTSCVNHPTYINKPANSDDIILQYTYAESKQLSGGLWSPVGNKNAEILRDLQVYNQNVDGSKKDKIFEVDSATDTAKPSVKVDFIQKLGAAKKGVEFLSNIIIRDVWLSGDGDNEGIWVDNSGNVGIGQGTPAYKLDVNGTTRLANTLDVAGITRMASNVDITQPVAATGDRAVRFGYEDGNNYFRIRSYGTGSTTPGRVLIDNVVGGDNAVGGYIDMRPDLNYMRFYASGKASGQLQFYTGATASMVIQPDGNTGVGIALPAVPLHVRNAPVDADLAAGTGAFMIGTETSTNLMMDSNEIYARNNSVLSPLYIRADGIAVNSALWIGESGAVETAPDIRMTSSGSIGVDNSLFIHIDGTGTNSGSFYIQTGAMTTPPATNIFRVNSDGQISATNNLWFSKGSTTYIGTQDATALIIRTANTNRMGFAADGSTINMYTTRLTNVVNPTSAQDAATKHYVDNTTFNTSDGDARYLRLAGGTMTGSITMGGTATINMGSSKITSLATPTAAADAATKAYVDSMAAGASDNLGSGGTTTGALYSKTASGLGYVGTDGNNLWRFEDSSVATTRALLRVDGTWTLDVRPSQLLPYATNTTNLGSSSLKFRNGYFATNIYSDGQFLGDVGDSAALPSFSFASDPDIGMWRAGTNAIGFSTAGVNRVTIGSTGVVTLTNNLTTPNNVTAGGQFFGDVGDSAAAPSFSFSGDPDTGMWRAGTNALGFTTAGTNSMTLSATGRLTVVERVYATGFYYSSDKNLKKDIKTVEDPFKVLNGFTGRQYVWKENGKPAYGLIAQEVETTMPEAVDYNDDTKMKAVDYNQVISPLVEGVKKLKLYYDELLAKVETLFDTTKALQKENDALKQRVDTLEKRLDALERAQKDAARKQ